MGVGQGLQQPGQVGAVAGDGLELVEDQHRRTPARFLVEQAVQVGDDLLGIRAGDVRGEGERRLPVVVEGDSRPQPQPTQELGDRLAAPVPPGPRDPVGARRQLGHQCGQVPSPQDVGLHDRRRRIGRGELSLCSQQQRGFPVTARRQQHDVDAVPHPARQGLELQLATGELVPLNRCPVMKRVRRHADILAGDLAN